MVIVTDTKQKNKRYLPHELTTKINSIKLYRQTKDIDFRSARTDLTWLPSNNKNAKAELFRQT